MDILRVLCDSNHPNSFLRLLLKLKCNIKKKIPDPKKIYAAHSLRNVALQNAFLSG